MLENTRGIVLRSIKYGDTSLITTIFTELHGIQTYMAQGVRTAKAGQNKAGLLQPATLLDLVVYQRSQKNMQRMREFQHAYLYQSVQEEVIKNSVALFSVELLFKQLPEHAAMPELFDFSFQYFRSLDQMPINAIGNFPLYFIIQCSRFLGYDIRGQYEEETPYLNLHENGFSQYPPGPEAIVQDGDAKALGQLLQIDAFNTLKTVEMNAPMRHRLLDWYIAFMHQHTQRLGNIKTLTVLRAILH